MDLSILLISYNTKKLTLAALDSILFSLKNAPFAYEVLVLDNCSTDGSPEVIRKRFGERVKLFVSKDNLGFGKGNNFLAKKARGKYLLLINSDTEVLDDAIARMFDFFTNQSRFDFVGAKLLNTDRTPQPSAGPLYSPLVVFAALFLKGDYWGLTRSSPDTIKQVGWVSGACIITAKDTYLKLGGFDENIFMYMEEVDLFKRAEKHGMVVGYFPEAHVIHHGFASSGSKSRPVINVFKGFRYYYEKHYPKRDQLIVRLMLKTKALTGYTLGVVTGNRYLKQTYEEAYKILN